MWVDPIQSGELSTPRRLRAVLGAAAGLVWHSTSSPLLLGLSVLEPLLRSVMITIGILGLIASVFLEMSGAAPRFPFRDALAFFGACIATPGLLGACLRMLARRG